MSTSRTELKKHNLLFNHIVTNKFIYILETNDKYTQCLKIEYNYNTLLVSEFKIGSDWERSMVNYYFTSRKKCLDLIFGEEE